MQPCKASTLLGRGEQEFNFGKTIPRAWTPLPLKLFYSSENEAVKTQPEAPVHESPPLDRPQLIVIRNEPPMNKPTMNANIEPVIALHFLKLNTSHIIAKVQCRLTSLST